MALKKPAASSWSEASLKKSRLGVEATASPKGFDVGNSLLQFCLLYLAFLEQAMAGRAGVPSTRRIDRPAALYLHESGAVCFFMLMIPSAALSPAERSASCSDLLHIMENALVPHLKTRRRKAEAA